MISSKNIRYLPINDSFVLVRVVYIARNSFIFGDMYVNIRPADVVNGLDALYISVGSYQTVKEGNYWFGLCCLMPLSTIFQLYRGGQH